MKRKFFKIIVFIFISSLFLAIFYLLNPFYRIVEIEGKIFFSEVVFSSQEQQRGLGGREKICGRCSMLFDFEETERRSFWMKDMKFDLDILWIEDSHIVYIEKNFSHKSLKTVFPDASADKVLEIKAGLSDKFGFQIGDRVKTY